MVQHRRGRDIKRLLVVLDRWDQGTQVFPVVKVGRAVEAHAPCQIPLPGAECSLFSPYQ